jgi:hypothetical protein
MTRREIRRMNELLSQSAPLGKTGAAELRKLLDKLHGRQVDTPMAAQSRLEGRRVRTAPDSK